MKTILDNQILVLLCRIFLGGLFVVASLDKIVDPNAFASSISNYKIVGTALSMLIATILPWLELICGLGLILGLLPKSSTLVIIILLLGFTSAVIYALIRGLDISCGCFTQDPNASKVGYQKIIENCGLILLGIYLYYSDLNKNIIAPFTKKLSI